ncbi:DNA topoisomerase 2-binding protein 1-A [Camellia lanceoleosa]|uniref:DNA topoisomerase 2-binding protein 1-A n=1 Tax=Camellia lanceoleosa TaxID=1840588 RepID=A0ACC0GPP7_9ERIC|nr:DNA topoisomerase 2-binding protein 1-A [Camellia lanceoleosa]
MMSKTFEGANVFMSRNLVPPEIFDSLHDSLKHNGAKLFLCSDPSRNGPDDFHVISSTDHEKFELLQKKGCNLLGPQCVLSCAKEHRPLPKQGFTCCLAMDGVKVLASGFEMDEKLEIGKMVTAMGGVLHAKTSLDVSFVIVKNVLAAKYKWALNVLKKPIVTLNWLHQCWKEHRIVSQESYRVLPFSGLTVCVTRIPADERREMEKVVVQNGGKYSAELTKKCDKYKVAKRWGHIHIVTRKWFDQSVSRRVCLNEESYPVQGGSSSSINGMRTCLLARRSQDKGVGNSQCAPSSVAGDSNLETVLCGGIADPELEATLSQNVSTTFSDTSIFVKEESGALAKQPKSDTNFDGCVADDSQNEDNDLYLSDCRILLLGFDASEMRKLVNMVRRGGGSRYMSFNEKLTHIVVGNPLEIEKKEVRGLAALGVIYVVRTVWLEDCDRTKKEVPVLQRHIAYELFLPKDPVCSNKGATMGIAGMKQGKASAVQSILPDDQLWGATNSGSGTPLDKNEELKVNLTEDSSLRPTVRSDKHIQFCALNGKDKDPQKTQLPSCNEILDVKSLNVFKGKLFRFASSFPQARRAEIIQWVNQGGGAVVDEHTEQNAHFTVECHGVVPSLVDVSRTTHISSHWIRSCLEDGCLLDVRSHILYSPLPCRVPFPGFERFRFCVSQYDEKDRLLLRNLCFILGARFVEKLTKKVTHLLCKFTNGPKYEAACKWRIQTVTCEWIYECIKQNEVVAPGPFCPKEVTSQDREAGLCTLSQYPTQATRMISGDNASQFPSQSQDPRNIQSRAIGTSDNSREEAKFSSICGKRARLFEEDIDKGILSSGSNHSNPTCKMTSTGNNTPRNTGEVSNAVPDVAAAIEDLLAQTSKIHDLKSPGSIECDKNLFSSDCSILGQDQADPHSAFVLSKHWINRADRKDDVCDPSGDRNAGMYDGFSETQTESQVVGYEEDLSGRQMIIDRVRTRSSMI